MKHDEEVWTVAEAAEILRVNKKTLYDLFKTQQVAGVARFGRQYRILCEPFMAAWKAGSLTSEEQAEGSGRCSCRQ